MNNFTFGEPRQSGNVTDRSVLVPVHLAGVHVADAQYRRTASGEVGPAGFLPHLAKLPDGLGDALDRYLKENRDRLERTIPV
jgi:hypothetical protein